MELSLQMKTGKKIALWSLGTFLFLFTALCIHIYVTTMPEEPVSNIQLARIDFKPALDSARAYEVQNFVNKLPGIDRGYFNIPDGVFVYGFYPEKQSAGNVFNEIMKRGSYQASRYVVSETQAKRGCPVMSGSDFTRRIAIYINRHL
jgi:hypothetical protein